MSVGSHRSALICSKENKNLSSNPLDKKRSKVILVDELTLAPLKMDFHVLIVY